jgi:hypothetical protein
MPPKNIAVYPKASVSWSRAGANYMVLSKTNNSTSVTTKSSNLTSLSTLTEDLSSNVSYTLSLTPYATSDYSGITQSITMNSVPKSTTTASHSNVQLAFVGAHSYVSVARGNAAGYSGTVSTYTDISSVVSASYFYDLDLSGNTLYSYKISSYNELGNFIVDTYVDVYTDAQPAYNITKTLLDTSSIRVSFTTPKNSYSSSFYYTLRATNSTTGTYVDVSGTTSPLQLRDLSDGTLYTCYIITTLDGSTTADSSAITLTTYANPKITAISSVVYDASAVMTVDGSFSNIVVYSAAAGVNKTFYSGVDVSASSLQYNTSYTFSITPYNVLGMFATATSYTLTTLPVITRITATGYDTSAVKLTWDGSYNSAELMWYESGAQSYSTTTVSSATSSAIFTGLSQGVTYYYTLTPTGTTGLTGIPKTATGYTLSDFSGMIMAAVGFGSYAPKVEMSGNIYIGVGYGVKTITIDI